ncbi:MAG: dockerin type I domain-containing protein, partial [Bacteroidota bacterium]
ILTPEFIADYFDALPATTGSGTAYAFPYIDRGFRVRTQTTTRDTIIQTIVPTNVQLADGTWAVLDVVVKDTQSIQMTTTDTIRNLIRLDRGTTCNLSVKYVDQGFGGCAGLNTKIRREWSILDFCSGRIIDFDQWIILIDTIGPNIEPIDSMIVGLVPWECTAELQLMAEAIDDCSGVDQQLWRTSAGTIDTNGILSNISISDNPIEVSYTAIDGCGNDSTVTFIVEVVDRVAPVALAADEINTIIVYDPVEQRGIAKASVDAIDLGSHDSDCGPVSRCVLLDEEWEQPLFFRDGSPARDANGNRLYRAVQCDTDGIFIDTISVDKDNVTTEEIPYVICKDAVKFCCGDVGIQRVALVVDDFSPDSPSGVSWTNVLVEDKSSSSIQCPTVVIECGKDYRPEEIGFPDVIWGICRTGELTYVDVEDFDGCGEGRIIRQWLIDGVERCQQTIIVNAAKPFDPLNIKWPPHYDDEIVSGFRRECEGDSIVYEADQVAMSQSFTCAGDAIDAPVWCQSTCSLLAVSHDDQEVEADGSCRKIIRKWTIIDWCSYRPNGNDADEDIESFIAIDDQWLDGDYPAGLQSGDDCELCDKPSGDIGTTYFRYEGKVDVDGFYNFQQIIKIEDDTAPEVDAPSFFDVQIITGAQSKGDDFDDCVGEDVVTAEAIELCGDLITDSDRLSWLIEVIDDEGTVLRTRTTTGATATMNTQQGTINDLHLIKWYVTDGCGNEGRAETIVRFVDQKAPTPVCVRDISTSTMNTDGSATIWAEDFDIGSYDNCSLVKVFFKDEDGFSTPSLSFNCDDIPNGMNTTKEIMMFVADDQGNEDFCFVTLSIDDNDNVCADTTVAAASIAGVVSTYKGDRVENARVRLNLGAETYTDDDGRYAFRDMEMLNSYRLISEKNDDPLNGVSTLDLVMIQRHILGSQRFDDPYQIIAGDVSGDTRISSIDLVQLRGLLLGRFTSFPSNQSWRFLSPEQDWDNPLSPFPFEENLFIEELDGDRQGQNFIGVKIGDVNGNAIANSLIAETRSVSTLQLEMPSIQVNAGDEVIVPLNVTQDMEVVGLQMALETNGLTIIDVVGPAKIGTADFN